MKIPKDLFDQHKEKTKVKFKEAIDYLSENQKLASILLIAALSSFFVLSYLTLLPVYAKEILKGNASTFGWLNSAVGIGAFAGTFYLATLKGSANFRKILLLNTFLLGISLLGFAYFQSLYVSFAFAMLSGFSSVSQSSIYLTIIQNETADEYRGRVISLIAMALFGMLPLGSLLVGYLAPIFGTTQILFAQGILGLILGIIFYKNLINTSKE